MTHVEGSEIQKESKQAIAESGDWEKIRNLYRDYIQAIGDEVRHWAIEAEHATTFFLADKSKLPTNSVVASTSISGSRVVS